ncbi:hypothetical protein RhiirC2_794600 [Rhizophagus irregularis]|uniref:Uncharacterized protein n=1 Tax=Rhizophagus irregularis TaxID=588596 RepID=A0A2N1MD97_9GLOM|nr:hypothetical protein RhiirC2_794600 [Rhizophagus irregularis]
MKERRYDLYGDVKCRMYLEENEDNDHIIYCQQLRDKWLMVANNTILAFAREISPTKSRGYITITFVE